MSSVLRHCPPIGPRPERTNREPVRLCLLGTSPDTGNLGVSALWMALLAGVAEYVPEAHLTAFDGGTGVRAAVFATPGRRFEYRRCGFRMTRRWHRPESLFQVGWAARFGGLGNPAARALLEADAVLDISGGDSFTDLYGGRRFRAATIPKRIALRHQIPLVLLPQTYGPFAARRRRRIAEDIVRRAAQAWARDERSFAALRELAGPEFDPARHRCGVDVAFALPAHPPKAAALQDLEQWWQQGTGPVVGMNISGLIYNGGGRAHAQFGFRADYRKAVADLVARLLHETDCRILLIPHVVPTANLVESDQAACQGVAEWLRPQHRAGSEIRLRIGPRLSDPREAKWLIGRCDWFCGTRMHATIAGLASGVPTAAIAYSLKTQGVFESCRQGEQVADLRQLTTEEVVASLWAAWQRRETTRARLATVIPGVRAQAAAQLREILAVSRRRPAPQESP